jgi:hypothetical protein
LTSAARAPSRTSKRFSGRQRNEIDFKPVGVLGWYFAILDADFDRILGIAWVHAAVFVTDLHDLECEYLHSPALEKVLREYGSRDRLVRRFGGSADAVDWPAMANSIRAELHRSGAIFGALRLVSIRKVLDLEFKELNQSSALKPKTIEVDLKKLLDLVLMNNPGNVQDRKQLARDVEAELAQDHDLWQLCQGHDLLTLFALGMRRMWCSAPPTDDVVEKSLRLGFEAAFFLATGHGKRVEQFLRGYEGEPELELKNGP